MGRESTSIKPTLPPEHSNSSRSPPLPTHLSSPPRPQEGSSTPPTKSPTSQWYQRFCYLFLRRSTNGRPHPPQHRQLRRRRPVFLSIDGTGKYLFVANYGGGSIAVLPIHTDGSLGTAVDSHVDIGNVGPTKATNAPPGSFAFSGHDAPHAHCILPDRNSKFILQTDLGQDRIYVYSFDPNTGVLTPADTPFVSIPPGDGPRHIFFHPNGRWLYCITEEASTLMVFSYNDFNGALTQVQFISSLPPGFKGSSFGSEVRVSPDGKFVYAANRLHDSIAVFDINFNGELKFVGEAATRGDYPRQFIIDPTGNFLYSCNQRSDNLTSYRINRGTGVPKFIGQYVAAGSPSCIIFLPQGRP